MTKPNSAQLLTESVKHLGRYISSQVLTINGYPAQEIIIKGKHGGGYTYSMMVIIYAGKTQLTLTYLVGGSKEEPVTQGFYYKKELFRKLAQKTQF
ncbi:hypothetical protein [Paraflavitalea speifideaquila]|uniref:hypothetical protein n=1 Tax=Paraflavitalea speifideaquila TaxID=3076558 RepID=UPI0028EF23B9|nr:hypothetical protein [Paraflavitalea speifideiaquila]